LHIEKDSKQKQTAICQPKLLSIVYITFILLIKQVELIFAESISFKHVIFHTKYNMIKYPQIICLNYNKIAKNVFLIINI